MKISVELTLSPLQNNFQTKIINFIKKLKASGLTVKENSLSTQVYRGLIFMKIVKSDLSYYAADF